jgi:hypothetical protein
MIRYFVGLKYTENPEQLQGNNSKPKPMSEILFQLMMATGVNRLFNKCQIKEFLFRLAICLHKYGVIKNFFTDDKIIEVDYDGSKIAIYLNDLIRHIGFEICDDEYPYTSRGMWLKNIDRFWQNAAAGAAISGAPIIAIEHISGNSYQVGVNKPGQPDAETIKLAKLFSDSAIKSIKVEKLKQLYKRVKDYTKLMNDYREFMEEVIPEEFDYDSIPLEIRNIFYKQINDAVDVEDDEYRETINNENSQLARLMYLTWLYVNGHVVEYKITREFDGGTAIDAQVDTVYEKVGGFDYDHYDGMNVLGIGVNIAETYYYYGLDKIAHLLMEKGSEDLK